MNWTRRQLEWMVVEPVEITYHFPIHSSRALFPTTTSLTDKDDDDDSGNVVVLPTVAPQQQHNHDPSYNILQKLRDKLYPRPFIRIPLQLSIHRCPKSMLKDVQLVFPQLSKSSSPPDAEQQLWIIPVFQKCLVDILGTGQAVEEEKARCLENFYLFGLSICRAVVQAGWWADITDPASGLPMLSSYSSDEGPRGFYPDVHGCQRLLGYELTNCGCCAVLSHPKYGTRVYPSTIFAQCPLEVLKQLLLL